MQHSLTSWETLCSRIWEQILMINNIKQLMTLALAFTLPIALVVQAGESQQIEEVVVTGSYIKGTPEDAASPVDVTTREDMNLTGNPNVLEMLRSMGPIAGIDGETNQFQSNGLEAISNVNLRGLGAGRSLVLLNGSRVVPSPFFIGQDGQQFVNTNTIPTIALERVELLKDGASATYGSDAIAGVVNFITRSDFRGLEFQGAWKEVPDAADPDLEAGIIYGLGTNRFDLVVSAAIQTRGELAVRDKGWALQPFEVNSTPGGWSSIGNPGTFFPLVSVAAAIAAEQMVFAAAFPDPSCETVGGSRQSFACRFRYIEFDNIAEEEEHTQLFIEATYDLDDNLELGAEFLWAADEAPSWKTSPSYPPQALLDGDQIVVPGMPHFDDFLARNNLTDDPNWAQGAHFWGRSFGVAGPAGVGTRKYDTYRLSLDLTGEIGSDIGFLAALTWGLSEGERFTKDTRTDNLAYAYRGLGGPNCDAAAFYRDPDGSGITPGSGNLGTGNCYYYNPFTSAYAASSSSTANGVAGPGSQDSTLLNHPSLEPWLTEFLGSRPETEQVVFDLVFNGESGVNAGSGNISWAAGLQWRHDQYDNKLARNSSLQTLPCAFGIRPGESFTIPETPINGGANTIPAWTYNCIGAGAFNFLAASEPFSDEQDVLALFGELRLPFSDNFEMQVAARFEDYGGNVGNTLDPKIAIRWQIDDAFTMRASVSSAFRAPTLNQLGGEFTALSFVGQALAFKAVDTRGNSDLAPEEALTVNLGIIWAPTENIYMSLDYWSFDFDAPIILESFNDVVGNCNDEDSAIRELACSKITYQDSENPTNAGIQRIAVDYQNGPGIQTTGYDFTGTYDFESGAGLFTLGFQGTLIRNYDVESWIWAPAFDAANRLNYDTATVRPLPQLKANFFFQWSIEGHNLRASAAYVGEYDDDRMANQGFTVDRHITFDVSYNFWFNNRKTRFFTSIYNVTDEDPPLALLDLNYDPYTHNPFGRIIKVGMTHRMSF